MIEPNLSLNDYISKIIKKHKITVNMELLYDKINKHIPNKDQSTFENIDYASHMCASLATVSPEYNNIAAIILIEYHRHTTKMRSFSETCKKLSSILRPEFLKIVESNASVYDSMIVEDRDFLIDYY